MKKSLLALAVAALSVSGAASAATVYDKDGTTLDVYGRVQAVFYSNHADTEQEKGQIKTSGRLGIDGRTNVFNGVDAFAKLEWDVADAKGNENFKARYAYLGLDFGQAGQVRVGRFEEAYKPVLGATDIFEDYGCLGQAGNDDKRDGILEYSWSGMGVEAAASVQFNQNMQHVDGNYGGNEQVRLVDGVWKVDDKYVGNEKANIANSYSLYVGYTTPKVVFGPISAKIGGAITNFEDKNHANVVGAYPLPGLDVSPAFVMALDKATSYAASLAWGSLDNGPYVGALYQQRKLEAKTIVGDSGKGWFKVKGYELAVGYALPMGVSFRTGYTIQEAQSDGEKKVKGAVIPVFVNYQINPMFNVWAEARFDAGTDDEKTGNEPKNFAAETGINVEKNVFSVGARYSF